MHQITASYVKGEVFGVLASMGPVTLVVLVILLLVLVAVALRVAGR